MGPGNNAKRVRENESNISLVMVDIIIPNSTSSPPGSNFLSHAPPPQMGPLTSDSHLSKVTWRVSATVRTQSAGPLERVLTIARLPDAGLLKE